MSVSRAAARRCRPYLSRAVTAVLAATFVLGAVAATGSEQAPTVAAGSGTATHSFIWG